MAIGKICGIETEYGIVHRGVPETNPITASSTLINAYVASRARKVGWDFEDETPGRDARGFSPDHSAPPEVETHLVNTVLTNGARYYVDHAHPEISTPECADARSIVVWDRAAEDVLRLSMEAARRHLPDGEEIVVYKNNSDRKGNSYGCHENYLMDRATPFHRIVRQVMPHFMTRIVFCGAGKVGTEAPGLSSDDVPFQITQRADFFEEEVGLETTLKRPLVNTRDEPHADPQKYRRLHVIVGDANLAEVSTYLKVGTTAIVLAMIEDDVIERDLMFAHPVATFRRMSYDTSLTQSFELADGTTATALEIQWEYLDLAKKYAESEGLAAVGESVGADVLARWEQVLTGLETDPATVADQVDWVAKRRIIDGYRQRNGLAWDDARLAAMDLQYHDIRPHKSLHAKVGTERITTDEEVAAAIDDPPTDTRAYFRGRCLQRWSEDVVAANWDSMVFDVGTDPLRRVPMMEPGRGTKDHVAELIDSCDTAADLVRALGA